MQQQQNQQHPFVHEPTSIAAALPIFTQYPAGIQLQAWSPLGGTRGAPMSDARVKQIAAAHGVCAAQVVLKWSLQRGVAVVTGTDNVAHMRSDLDLWGFSLTDAEMNTISALSSTAPKAELSRGWRSRVYTA